MVAPSHDWNQAAPGVPGVHWLAFGARAAGVKLVDETLRDGLQSCSGANPPVSYKIDLLHAMAAVGVDVVSVGLPAAGGSQAEDAYLLCREIAASRLPLVPTGAARTVVADVAGIARAADRSGVPIEVYSFIGSSPIRQYVEGWDLEFLVRAVVAATREAVKNNLPFTLVTEDTTRSHPDVLRTLFRATIDAGASRLCLCDTTGHITPYGVEELVAFTRRELAAVGAERVGLDWHAHNDRGLGVPTALWAASNGVDRVHGTGLGVGERVGNTALELLVENLGLLGARPVVPRARLVEYCELASRALGFPLPGDHPIAGARLHANGHAVTNGHGRVVALPYRAAPIPVHAPSAASATRGDAPARSVTRGHAAPPERRRDPLIPITLHLEGGPVELAVRPRRTLLEALRYDLDLVGTKQGCDKGDCGACTVILGGQAVLSCLTLAMDADGCEVRTVEALAGAPDMDPLLDCFDRVGGGQCGFCTPGMLMSATALLDRNPRPTRPEIQLAISGNLCRCTGYGRIVDAVEQAAAIRRGDVAGAAAGTGYPRRNDLPGRECVPPPLAANTAPAPRAPKQERS